MRLSGGKELSLAGEAGDINFRHPIYCVAFGGRTNCYGLDAAMQVGTSSAYVLISDNEVPKRLSRNL